MNATAAVTEEQLRGCVERIMRCPEADAVLPAPVPTAVAAVRLEQDLPVRLLPATDGGAIPSYAELGAAARALAHAVRRSAWLRRPAGTIPTSAQVDTARAHAVAEAY